jgi:hypothetical protein
MERAKPLSDRGENMRELHSSWLRLTVWLLTVGRWREAIAGLPPRLCFLLR